MIIKSRKQREKEYAELYGSVSLDQYERLKNKLGNKFSEVTLRLALEQVREAHEKLKYNCIRFTFYEIPIQTYRPRSSPKLRGLYVPNAAANYDAIDKFLNSLNEKIKVIALPMKIILTAYMPMPSSANAVETVIYETENAYAIGKPDYDNICKSYTDMIQKHLILDDDLVVSSVFNKYYSLKPRVVLDIIFPNGVITNHMYKTITSRKSYKELDDRIETELIVSK